MIERSAYRFRIYPDTERESLFFRTIGCCRLVSNLCLEQRTLERHRSEPRRLGVFEQCAELSALKVELPFLKSVPHHPLVQAIHDLQKAFNAFFEGRAAYPKPKRKFRHESFRYPDPKQIKVEADRIFLPKAGWVRMVGHRVVVGRVKNVTVSHRAGMWHVSIQVEHETDEPSLRVGAVEGGDLGVVNACTMSDGRIYDLPRVTEKERRQLAAIQKTIARRRKGSRNRAKAIRRQRSLQARHARRRADAKHRMTADIVKRYAVYVGEDLRVLNMTASARGTVDVPGSNVAQKAGLNRSILDVSPGATRFQIEYKMRRSGGLAVFVDPRHTSQRCSRCGHVNAANRPSRDAFACVSCGFAACADHNAALNIRQRGIEALASLRTGGLPGLACGSSRAGGRKQERIGRKVGNLSLTDGSPVLQGGE